MTNLDGIGEQCDATKYRELLLSFPVHSFEGYEKDEFHQRKILNQMIARGAARRTKANKVG